MTHRTAHHQPPALPRRLWSCRWSALRLALALFLLWAFVVDTPSRFARLRLHALPDFDFAADAADLRAKGRFSEAVASADAGLTFTTDPAATARLQRERTLAQADLDSYLRRARDLGLGALTGSGRASSSSSPDDEYATLERLAGSVIADFFIVGDVRDLVIQGLNAATGRDTDPVIAALSALGLITTAAPQVDWGASLLKAARRSGAMTKGLTDVLLRAARTGDARAARALADDAASLARHTSPSAAARLIRLADDPADVARIARFVESHGPAGAAALRLTGSNGLDFLRHAAPLAPNPRTADQLLLAAARKGPPGGQWLRHGNAAALLKPHALIGLTKVFYKGDAPDLARKLAALADAHAWYLIPALAAWITLESWSIARKLLPTQPLIRTSRAPTTHSPLAPLAHAHPTAD